MSLQMHPIGPVPEETERVARSSFPKSNIYLRIRDELGAIYDDETFASLYPSRGQSVSGAIWLENAFSVKSIA